MREEEDTFLGIDVGGTDVVSPSGDAGDAGDAALDVLVPILVRVCDADYLGQYEKEARTRHRMYRSRGYH